AAPRQVVMAPAAPEEPPAAVATPVVSATVTTIDPRDVAAIRAAHMLDSRVDDGANPLTTVPQ
ncbi:MAG TPA: hypothetical protein VF555_17045, partial [Variovorax sp.]